MYVGLTEEQQQLRDDLRSYYGGLISSEDEAVLAQSEGVGELPRKMTLQMAADGWLGIGWPVEFGGQGRTPIDQYLFFDESMRASAPVPMLTINTVAPTLMRYGSEEQKQFFLPKMLAGQIHFAIGYTEPEAGTDLAALRTKAVRDGDEWVINGQKIFTSLAKDADYVWLACRTNSDAPKHRGISIIIVPTSTPGFSAHAIHNMGGLNTNITLYEDVRVPVSNLVGTENRGWDLIVNQLNHERVTLCSAGIVERQLEDIHTWACETSLADGSRVIDQQWVQQILARVHAKLEFLKLANWKVAWEATNDIPLNPADASTIKVYGTEYYLEAFRLLIEVLGAAGTLREGSPGAVLNGRLERLVRGMHILTFGGGVNELQRDLIALFGLGLPPSER